MSLSCPLFLCVCVCVCVCVFVSFSIHRSHTHTHTHIYMQNLLSKPTESSVIAKYKNMMVGQKLIPLVDNLVGQKPYNDEELIVSSEAGLI